jgi:phage terminase large subunit
VELTTQSEQAALKIKECQYNSPLFVRRFFAAEPDPWQLEALAAMDSGSNVSIRSGHGTGKTALKAWGVIQTLTCFPFAKVPCTAPTQHQLSDLLWAEVAYWLNRSPLKGLINWTATKLTMAGYDESWFAVARSCAIPENLAGFHAPKLRYFVDEASGVPDNIMAVVDGALTTEGSQIIMGGNPTRVSGYFFDSHHKSRASWHTVHISSEESPRVSKSYAVNMAAKWGRDSDIYRVRVLGDFPNAEADGFIALPLVEEAVERWHDAKPDGICEIGADIARFGDDETVFGIREGGYVHPLECHRKWSTTETSGRLIQLGKDRKPGSIKIDDTGVGGGVTDLLSEANLSGTRIIPVNFGGEGGEHYSNTSSAMWGNIRDMLRAGELALPNDEELVAQLTTRRYRLTSKGKIEIERKEDMKKRGLPSPDRADAVALALWQPARDLGIW